MLVASDPPIDPGRVLEPRRARERCGPSARGGTCSSPGSTRRSQTCDPRERLRRSTSWRAEQAAALTDTLRRLDTAAGDDDRSGQQIEPSPVPWTVRRQGRRRAADVRSALDDLLVRSLGLLRQAGSDAWPRSARWAGRRRGRSTACSRRAAGYRSCPCRRSRSTPMARSVTGNGPVVITVDRGRRCASGRPRWSARLADEGHPIEPGSAGENISVSGLDWATGAVRRAASPRR